MSRLRGIIVLNDVQRFLVPIQEMFEKTYKIKTLAYGHLQFAEIYFENRVVTLKANTPREVAEKYYEVESKKIDSLVDIKYVRQLANLVNLNDVEVLILVDQPDSNVLARLKQIFNVPTITIFYSSTQPSGTIDVKHPHQRDSYIQVPNFDFRVSRRVKLALHYLMQLKTPPDRFLYFVMGFYVLFTLGVFFTRMLM